MFLLGGESVNIIFPFIKADSLFIIMELLLKCLLLIQEANINIKEKTRAMSVFKQPIVVLLDWISDFAHVVIGLAWVVAATIKGD